MKKYVLSLVLILFTFVLFSQKKISKKCISEEKSISVNTCDLKGTLLIPKKVESANLVILIAGSGPTDRNGNNTSMKNNSLKMLAEGLCLNGIASFRYDKRMIGKSIDTLTTEENLRFETYINDATEIVNYFKKDKRFDKIIIAGHSEGSLIGMIAAEKTKIDKYISLAGVAISADEILKEQLKKKKSIKDESYAIIDSLKNGIEVDSVSKNLQVIFRKSVQPYMISWFKFNPQTEIAKLDIPILIIQGNNDIQVDTTNAELLHKANPESELHIISGMNHILKPVSDNYVENSKTYYYPDLELHPDLLNIIVSFVEK